MAWAVPKLGTVAETTVTGGNLTLTEPAGVAQGDLMIAAIGCRDNAAFTVPADWNLVATQQSSGDTDATDGIAGAVMMYTIRGASAPTLTFNRTGGNVARGAIVSYGPGASTTAIYDTGSANTLGVGATTATTGTITTAVAGELIVAMLAAGDTNTVSAFDAATDPTTASGATDTTTAPTNGTWLERIDSSTATGADLGFGVADAIRANAGATGTIQATVSGPGRHAMVVGAWKLVSTLTASVSDSANNLADGAPALVLGCYEGVTDNAANLSDSVQLGLGLVKTDDANNLADVAVVALGLLKAVADDANNLADAIAIVLGMTAIADDAANWSDDTNVVLGYLINKSDDLNNYSDAAAINLQAAGGDQYTLEGEYMVFQNQ
jgi:hypothetical protein